MNEGGKDTLLIVSEALGGGVYSVIFEQIKILSGNYRIIVAASSRCELDKDYLDQLSRLGCHYIHLEMKRGFSPLLDIKSAFRLLLIQQSEGAKFVHLHSSKAGFVGRLIYPFFKFRSVKVFYTPHCYSFLNLEFSKTKRWIFYVIEKVLGRMQTATIACGPSEFYLAKKFGTAKLIENGIEDIGPCEYRLQNRFKVASSGRSSMQKNPDLFIKIALALPEVDFIWIGDIERDVPPNITVTGWVEKENVQSLLGECNLYIQCSLWEGLAMAQIEAMALGKPLLAFNVLGTRDPVIEGVNGYLFSTVNEAVECIRFLQSNTEKCALLSENSRALYLESYTNFNFNKMVGLYEFYN